MVRQSHSNALCHVLGACQAFALTDNKELITSPTHDCVCIPSAFPQHITHLQRPPLKGGKRKLVLAEPSDLLNSYKEQFARLVLEAGDTGPHGIYNRIRRGNDEENPVSLELHIRPAGYPRQGSERHI